MRTFTRVPSVTTMRSAKEDMEAKGTRAFSPRWRCWLRLRPWLHRFGRPVEQYRQVPQKGTKTGLVIAEEAL